MKKIFLFFIGILILLLMFLALYFSGAIFDAGDNRHTDSFIFQSNDLSAGRIDRPIPEHELSDNFMREKLIQKFITEYFYILPAPENIAMRTRGDSIMAAMSGPNVFHDWSNGMAKEILKLSQKKSMRTVRILDQIVKTGDYYMVNYELKTWDTPNNMDAAPIKTIGVMYLEITFERGLRKTRGGKYFDIEKYLANGGNPAAIFNFRVDKIQN